MTNPITVFYEKSGGSNTPLPPGLIYTPPPPPPKTDAQKAAEAAAAEKMKNFNASGGLFALKGRFTNVEKGKGRSGFSNVVPAGQSEYWWENQNDSGEEGEEKNSDKSFYIFSGNI